MIGVVMIMTIKTPGLSYVHQTQNESPRRKNYKTQKIEDAYDPYHKPVIFKISCLAKKALFFFPRISTPFSQRRLTASKNKRGERGAKKMRNTVIHTHGNTQQADS